MNTVLVSGTDAYVTATIAAAALTAAAMIAWAVERHTARRRRAAAIGRIHRAPEYREFEAAMRRVQTTCGTAIYGPFSRMVAALGDIANAAPTPPGTIQNPADPSPSPRPPRRRRSGLERGDIEIGPFT